MAAVSSDISMYRHPTYYGGTAVPLPSCMYGLPSYYQTNTNIEVQLSSSSLQSLERKQEDILRELNGLKTSVEEVAKRLGVSLPRPKVKVSPTTCDFVIFTSPNDPPLIISILQHIMKQRGLAHTTAMFSHSSVKEPIPDSVRTQFQNFSKCNKEVGRAPVILTIVWKEEGDLPSLVVSPSAHNPMTGEITIARFFCRTFLPDLYGNLTPEESACVDYWIDKSLASSKERTAALKSLELKLAKQWILGGKMTLADIALACSIVKQNGPDLVHGDARKWMMRIPGLLTK